MAYFGQGKGDECHMAFHFPLMPRLFMAVRMEDRTPIVDILEQTPPIPETSQWALVPAQPRRADAGNGDRRGARLHVPDVCPRPPGAAQPGHPPPAGAAAGQRPQAHRTAQRAAVLPARHAGALLRRRDRHGRQHLPGRPQRRAHADAVEFGQERRLLPGQPAGAVSADHLRPGIPLRSGERGGAAAQSALAALVDAAAAGAAQKMARAGRGQVRVPPAGEPQDPQLRPPRRAGDAAGGGEPLALRAARGTGPLRLQRARAGRVVRPHAVPGHRRTALLPDAGAAQLLLVLAGAARFPPAQEPGQERLGREPCWRSSSAGKKCCPSG